MHKSHKSRARLAAGKYNKTRTALSSFALTLTAHHGIEKYLPIDDSFIHAYLLAIYVYSMTVTKLNPCSVLKDRNMVPCMPDKDTRI
jgi:hypothetical protein